MPALHRVDEARADQAAEECDAGAKEDLAILEDSFVLCEGSAALYANFRRLYSLIWSNCLILGVVDSQIAYFGPKGQNCGFPN